LLNLARDGRAGTGGECTEFGQGIITRDTDGRSQFNTDQNGALGVVERRRMRETQRQTLPNNGPLHASRFARIH
jgi:hypothetical protein